VPVIKRLPQILKRIRETADRIIAAKPDAIIIIDSPDFTHRVARRVKRALPHIVVINYVSPSVWAWRSGRAKVMRNYIDHVLALLPFEPDAHKRLGGPECTYVGHPLIERLTILRPNENETLARQNEKRILILPGSRRSEISRLMPIFKDVVAQIYERDTSLSFYLPAVDHLYSEIEIAISDWPVKPTLLKGEDAKYKAFREARAALPRPAP
jgi:lipid-A-disaccharide synthase